MAEHDSPTATQTPSQVTHAAIHNWRASVIADRKRAITELKHEFVKRKRLFNMAENVSAEELTAVVIPGQFAAEAKADAKSTASS